MRMCIAVAGFTMSSPPGMTNANMCTYRFTNQSFFQFGNLTFFLINMQTSI